MKQVATADEVAAALLGGITLIVRRLQQLQAPGELTIPERAALHRLDRGGPASAADLARAELISPQAMGMTLAALEARNFVERHSDPADARRVIASLSVSGREIMKHKRDIRTRQFAEAMEQEFSSAEIQALAAAVPLIKRLGEHI